MKAIAIFTNKGGVGKTTLLCNLAAKVAERRHKVLVVDADPQANATQYMFEDAFLDNVFDGGKGHFTIYDLAKPLSAGKGYSTDFQVEKSKNFGVEVLLGDPKLALIEDTLAVDWNSGGPRGMRTTLLFREMLSKCQDFDFVFFDMGPSLGSINRAVLIACDYFILPMSIDIFSVRATSNISQWMTSWTRNLTRQMDSIDDKMELGVSDLDFRLKLLGYVNQQYTAKRDTTGERRPVKAYEKIMKAIPNALNGTLLAGKDLPEDVQYLLGTVQNLHSLVPMSQSSHKPIFELKGTDGIVGAHFAKVTESAELFDKICDRFFENLEELNG